MSFAISDIKNLRDKTGAGVADCRRVLEEASGDIVKAVEILQKTAYLKAEKKSEREIKNGSIFSYIHGGGKVGVLLKLGCETDFVAKTDDFSKLGKEICLQIVAMDTPDIPALLDSDYIRDSSMKIKDLINAVIAKTGENCSVVGFSRFCI
jgi:elongation factor Ts